MSCSCRLAQWVEGLVLVQECPFQEADLALQGGAGISNDQDSVPGAESADLVTGAQYVAGRATTGTARPRDIPATKPPQTKPPQPKFKKKQICRATYRNAPTLDHYLRRFASTSYVNT